MSDATSDSTFTAADIRFGGGVSESDRELIAETMQEVIGRLGQLHQQSDVALSIKDRDSADPRTTLEVQVGGRPRLVATSSLKEPRDAFNEVSDIMVRQLRKQAERNEPKNNRQRRDSIRS